MTWRRERRGLMQMRLLAVATLALSACLDAEPRASGAQIAADAADAADAASETCTEQSAGCTCRGDQPPVVCYPDAPPTEDSSLCHEGTRQCTNGVWGECEDVHAYPARPAALSSALVDQTSAHLQCSDCDPLCFRVVDTLDPAAGPLQSSFAPGVVYSPLGSGLTLEPGLTASLPPPPAGLPPGSIGLVAPVGVLASALHQSRYHPASADVYLLLERTPSMAEESLWLHDRFVSGAAFLPSTLLCSDGSSALLKDGIAPALACMYGSVELGVGMFRDLPFSPYAEDQSLPLAARDADAKSEIAFRHLQSLTGAADVARAALLGLGAPESSGDPDVAGSQIPALHAIATGQGLAMGLDRPSVPDAAGCAGGRSGYPCFRDQTSKVVVLLTDAPLHNGPLPQTYPYDYDPADLTSRYGTVLADVAVPPTNDDLAAAYPLGTDIQNSLATYTGTTSGFAADIPASAVACSSDPSAADAVFRFDVGGTGQSTIHFSTSGTGFPATFSVHGAPPGGQLVLPPSTDQNELFPSATDLGSLRGAWVSITGDTSRGAATDMDPDYQRSLFATSCGASTLAPDAVYALDVGASGAPVDVEVTAEMGSAHPVLSIYEQGVGALPRWPVYTTSLSTSGNDTAHGNPYTLAANDTNAYVSVRGDTTGLTADYDDTVLDDGSCGTDAAAPDAAFRIRVNGTRTLRFDTDGSSFDTVISLHSQPPLASTGNWVTHPATSTHQNQNEAGPSAYFVGDVTGTQAIYEGDTTGMTADLASAAECGLDGGCGDAVYSLDVRQRTTLRLAVDGTGFTPGLSIARADPSEVAGHVTALAVGDQHSCALSGGAVYCWGENALGQLGNGDTTGATSLAAVAVSGLANAVQIAAGASHSCAVLRDGSVSCWGSGLYGKLGDGGTANAYTPVQVPGLGTGSGALGRAVQVTAGDGHSCALLHDGTVACWGRNHRNQAGGIGARPAPERIPDGGQRFVQVASRGNHSCAIRQGDRRVMCWGEGLSGRLGDGSTSNHAQANPTLVGGSVLNATHLMLGSDFSCAVLASGRVMCWGEGELGRLGQGSDTSDRGTPVAIQNYNGTGLLDTATGDLGSAGRAHACARTLEGYVFCWGDNSRRQLGSGSTSGSIQRPIGVSGLIDALQVVSHRDHTCALRRNGNLVCWGEGLAGKLGDLQTGMQSRPVRAHPSSGNGVSFGNGQIDLPFQGTCQSRAQMPEPGCNYTEHPATGQAYAMCTNHGRTWHSAGLACKAAGMELVDVDASGENAFVASYLDSPTWIGVKRASSSSWLDLQDNVDFQNLDDELVWHTDTPYSQSCLLFFCSTTYTRGHFVRPPGGPAAPDLVDSNPWSGSSTWVSNSEPKPTDTNWGDNCVTLNPMGKWATDDCSAVPEPMCSGLLGCLLQALVGAVSNLLGGALEWLVDGLNDVSSLSGSNGGVYSSPHFAGGVEHDYVCEQHDAHRDLTLDPGRYYVTVSGIADGNASNACEGAYRLSIADLKGPSGGLLACNDNAGSDSAASAIETTLSAGDYYVVVKGKGPGDQGAYNLTMRDVSLVQTSELACDASGGSGDPALLNFTAQPGSRYYALLKGQASGDRGSYTLTARDTGSSNGNRLACISGPAQSGAQLDLPLGPGSYYAVLKGDQPTAEGDYRLTIGGAAGTTSTFTPPTYTEARNALVQSSIKVATVLSCNSGAPCSDAQGQAQALATDTGGVVQVAQSASEVPQRVVDALYALGTLDTLQAALLFQPDANPGFGNVRVVALSDPNDACTDDPQAPDTLLRCGPGASPSYRIELENPWAAPIAPGPGPDGSYQFTLRLQGSQAGMPVFGLDVPVFVVPGPAAPAGTYGIGSYFQDVDSRACPLDSNLRGSFKELVWQADVRPDTYLEFEACAASDSADLASCDSMGTPSSGYRRVVTISAGGGQGTPCLVSTQSVDCPGGYCSPYTSVCQFLEGASCTTDSDCPGSTTGRCSDGPSAARIGKSCLLPGPIADPSTALDERDFEPHVRFRATLESLGDGSRTPALFSWETRYHCRSVM
jgi:alpha-tubulin suppressor-like RCC1 family protein